MQLENSRLKVECLPESGGKITSFFHKEKRFELAAQSSAGSAPAPSAGGNFAASAFGMDDAFPNINAERVLWKGRSCEYPDHGEIWSAGFEVTKHTDTEISMYWKSLKLGYCYYKRLCLEGESLRIFYHITNEGMEELPCIWTWHGLMRYEEDMEVLLPQSVTYYRNVLSGSVLGTAGTIYPSKNDVYDFSKVPEAKSRSMVKFYAEEPVREGRCGVRYPSQAVACMMEYDAKALPYFGFWVTAGGFQGDYNCALEPCNGFYDSISRARENGKLPILAAGESMEFEIKIMLQ